MASAGLHYLAAVRTISIGRLTILSHDCSLLCSLIIAATRALCTFSLWSPRHHMAHPILVLVPVVTEAGGRGQSRQAKETAQRRTLQLAGGPSCAVSGISFGGSFSNNRVS